MNTKVITLIIVIVIVALAVAMIYAPNIMQGLMPHSPPPHE